MAGFYIIYRMWPGFTSTFPYSRFEGVDQDQLAELLLAVVTPKLPSDAELLEWEKLDRKELLRGSADRSSANPNSGRPSSHQQEQFRKWRNEHQKTVTPPSPALPIYPLFRKLQLLGWLSNRVEWTPGVFEQVPLARVKRRSEAESIAQSLEIHFGSYQSNPKFYVLASAKISKPQRGCFEQQLAALPALEKTSLVLIERVKFAATVRKLVEYFNSKPPEFGKKRGGRPSNTDRAADARLAELWNSGHFKSLEELANSEGITAFQVRRAIDRHRKHTKTHQEKVCQEKDAE